MANHLDMGFTSWTWHKLRNSAHSHVNYDIIIPRKYFLVIDSFHWTVGTTFNGFSANANGKTQNCLWALAAPGINKQSVYDGIFFLMNGEKTVLKIGTSTRMNGVCYLTIAIIKLKRLNELVAISVQINNSVFFRSIQVEGNYSLLFNSLHFFGVEFKDGPLWILFECIREWVENVNIGENYA